MPFQLQRAPELANFAAKRFGVRIKQARHLHGERAAAGNDPTRREILPGCTRHRERIHPRMLPEPAIFIIDQRFKVTWRNIFDCYRITPDAVSIGETPEWRTILRHHHACRIHFLQWQRPEFICCPCCQNDDKGAAASIIQQPRLVNRRGIYGLTINRSSAAPVARH